MDSNGNGGNFSDIKQMVNHLEFHQVITEKAALFIEMSKFCDNQKENVFDVCLPITFYVEVNDIDK
jgi:anaerobic selenocysteine-containing dehydrogenase